MFFAVVALFFGSFLLTSCSKKADELPATKQITHKSTYRLKSASYNDADIKKPVMQNAYSASDGMKGLVELHVNEPGATAGNTATSYIKIENSMNEGLRFDATVADGENLLLSFENTYPVYAAGQDQQYMIPSDLLNGTVFRWADQGNYITFQPSCLSGSYRVSAITDGFKLTLSKPGKEIVLEFADLDK